MPSRHGKEAGTSPGDVIAGPGRISLEAPGRQHARNLPRSTRHRCAFSTPVIEAAVVVAPRWQDPGYNPVLAACRWIGGAPEDPYRGHFHAACGALEGHMLEGVRWLHMVALGSRVSRSSLTRMEVGAPMQKFVFYISPDPCGYRNFRTA